MVKARNRRLIAILSVLLAVCLFATVVSPTVVLAADTGNTRFEDSNVLDDLQSSEQFNILAYPFDETGLVKSPGIVNFVEYCYSYQTEKRLDYGLYVYFYNPQGIEIDTVNGSNKIQIAVAYDNNGNPTQYDKFGLQFCNMSTEPDYYGLFYKFKVIDKISDVDGMRIVDRVNSNERRYDVSGIELVTEGQANATEYHVGGTYRFTGYAKGFGADENAESTLYCKITELETLTLDVQDTNYRMDSVSHLGEGHQNDLHSVYFSVPNSILEKYGNLRKIKAEWYEYRTGPIIVTEDKGLYDSLKYYIGHSFTQSEWDNLQYKLYSDMLTEGGSVAQVAFMYWWLALNDAEIEGTGDNDGAGFPIEFIPYLFYTGGADVEDYTLTGEELKEYIYNYTASYNLGYLDVKDKQLSADLFVPVDAPVSSLTQWDEEFGRKYGYNCYEFDAGDTFDMLSYDDTHSEWDKFWDYFLFPPETSGTVRDIEPIYQVKGTDVSGSDTAIASRLLINVSDVADFRAYYAEAISKNETVFLFRFAQTDYLSCAVEYTNGTTSHRNKAYVASENVFMDFDVIQLTFTRNGTYTVIPAVSDPTDVVGDITAPIDIDDVQWWKIIVGILLVIALLVLLSPILPYIIHGIVWLVSLPVKGISALVRMTKESIKKVKEKSNKNKED